MTQNFDALGVSAPVLGALHRMGITEPTPVQEQSLPVLLQGRDACIQAPTGSGKTAAFVLPLVELCLQANTTDEMVALVLCPTRELATQGAAFADAMFEAHGFRTACLIGGVGYAEQRLQLKRMPQIVFGSPGRVMDHIWEGRLDVSKLRAVVLDEADQLLDQGFAPEVKKILSFLPSGKQTILVSATLPTWVQDLVRHELHNPAQVSVAGDLVDEGTIDHTIVETTAASRFSDLCRLLEEHQGETAIVFGRTKWGVQKLERQLSQAGFTCEAMQGNMTQAQRERALDRFRERRSRILVTTNVAARGLDIRHVGLVVNYELPESAELMTHRVGRTGRMGASGIAITMIAPEEEQKWRRLRRGIPMDLERRPRGSHHQVTPVPSAGQKHRGR